MKRHFFRYFVAILYIGMFMLVNYLLGKDAATLALVIWFGLSEGERWWDNHP